MYRVYIFSRETESEVETICSGVDVNEALDMWGLLDPYLKEGLETHFVLEGD